jgi:hypothetical protein
MGIIDPPVTYQGIFLGRYRMDSCPNCHVRLLTPEAARVMRRKVDAEIRARRLHSVPPFLDHVPSGGHD